jgi:hypothetical protein
LWRIFPGFKSGIIGRWEKGARNLQPDVKIVQGLLRGAAKTLEAPEIDPDVGGAFSGSAILGEVGRRYA